MTCTISFLENTVFWFVLFAFETGTYCVSIAILELPNITTGLELTLLHLPLPTECCYKSSASIGNTSLKVGYTLCSTSVSSQGWSVPMIWMWTLIRYIYVQQGKHHCQTYMSLWLTQTISAMHAGVCSTPSDLLEHHHDSDESAWRRSWDSL